MDDFKKVAVELYELVLEEHAILALGALTSSKDMIKCFTDTSLKVNKFLNEHDGDFEKALFEVKANEMLNQEI